MLLIFYQCYMFIVYLCSLFVNLLFCVYSRIFCSYGDIYRHPFGPWTGRDLFHATFGMTCRASRFSSCFFFVPFKGQLPKLSCKRHWGSVLSLGLIERHSIRSTLLQNVMLRKKAPYNVYQCISVFNKWQFESIGSFSLDRYEIPNESTCYN